MKFTSPSAAALLSLATLTATANAAVVFGNLGPSGTGTIRSTGVSGPTASTNPRNLSVFNLAQAFTVSSPGWTLDSIKLGFLGTADIKLSIHSDSSGAPGAEITSQTVTINTTSTTPFPGTTYSFTPLPLTTGLTYWVVASKVTSEPSIFSWTLSDSYSAGSPSAAALVEQNDSDWLYAGTLYQPTGGGSWSDATVVAGNGQYAALSISATPVPEPGTWALGLVAVAACVGIRRR